MQFPIFKTKIEGLDRKFNLIDPKEQEAYFEAKAGKEIRKLREYLKEKTFIAYLLGKKNSGKGTYSKMLANIIDPERISHFSIGDMIRDVDKELKDAYIKSGGNPDKFDTFKKVNAEEDIEKIDFEATFKELPSLKGEAKPDSDDKLDDDNFLDITNTSEVKGDVSEETFDEEDLVIR